MGEGANQNVPLGKVWELPGAGKFMEGFEREYEAGSVPTSGLREREGRLGRELIHDPLDYPIDWLGTAPAGRDHAVAARRRLPPRRPIDKYLFAEEGLRSADDLYADLQIPHEHWTRLVSDHMSRLPLYEWQNMTGYELTPDEAPRELQRVETKTAGERRAKGGRPPRYKTKKYVREVLERMASDEEKGLPWLRSLRPKSRREHVADALKSKELPRRTTLDQWINEFMNGKNV